LISLHLGFRFGGISLLFYVRQYCSLDQSD
jgi:hypothetical protein